MIDNDNSNVKQDAGEASASSPRERQIRDYADTRGGHSVGNGRRRAADALGEAPLIALAGGIAAGALIAALLPRTESETRLIRPTAKRVREGARAAARAAKDTGSRQLSELGLTREKGEETIRSLFQGMTEAAKASAESALDAARSKPRA